MPAGMDGGGKALEHPAKCSKTSWAGMRTLAQGWAINLKHFLDSGRGLAGNAESNHSANSTLRAFRLPCKADAMVKLALAVPLF